MASTTRWEIDPAHARVDFSVKHMLLATVRGRFATVHGHLDVNEERPDESRVDVEVDAGSIDTGVASRDAQLKSADFLDVTHYPVVRFESRRVRGAAFEAGRRFEVAGELTIRGSPIRVTLAATCYGWGGARARFGARAEIDRRAWGLQWSQAVEAAGLLVGNTVKVDIEIEAVAPAAEQRATKGAGGSRES